MYLVSILPLVPEAQGEVTYISSTQYPEGSVISVPWKIRFIQGVVTHTGEAAPMKSFLRHASFQVRRIPETYVAGWVPVGLVSAIRSVAAQWGTPPAALLTTFVRTVPERIREPKGVGHTTTYIEGSRSSRIDYYTHLARTEHITIITPTLEEARMLKAHVPDATVSDIRILRALPDTTTTLILDRESSEGYVMKRRPYADMRELACAVARVYDLPLIVADEGIRLERAEDAPVISLSEHRMPHIIERKEGDGSLITLPTEVYEAIQNTATSGGSVFVYAARSGRAQSIVCRDCGALYTCPICSSPMRLRTTASGRILWCPRCKHTEPPDTRCNTCDSWNIVDLGIGSEKIMEELKDLSPVLIDTFHTTVRGARKQVQSVHTNGGIVIGTKRVLPFLESVSLAVVPTIDSLLTLPHWRSRESLARTLFTISSRAERTLVVTRQKKELLEPLFRDSAQIREEERVIRTRFVYPPYTHLLGITTPKEEPRLRNLPSATYVGESVVHHEGKRVYRMRFRVDNPRDIAPILSSLPHRVRVEWNPEWW